MTRKGHDCKVVTPRHVTGLSRDADLGRVTCCCRDSMAVRGSVGWGRWRRWCRRKTCGRRVSQVRGAHGTVGGAVDGTGGMGRNRPCTMGRNPALRGLYRVPWLIFLPCGTGGHQHHAAMRAGTSTSMRRDRGYGMLTQRQPAVRLWHGACRCVGLLDRGGAWWRGLEAGGVVKGHGWLGWYKVATPEAGGVV